jgi:hypothetical protein
VAAALVAGAFGCAWASPAGAQPRVTIDVLPPQTTVDDLATVPRLSLGVMSTGIGDVPAEQTYLDISQGNRIDDSLYPRPLPPLPPIWMHVPHWEGIVNRAEGAPAQIVPGLMASSLLEGGIRSDSVPAAETAALIVAQRNGTVPISNFGFVTVFSTGIGLLRKQAPGPTPDELMIAFVEPTTGRQTTPIGIAGSGFAGNLTSDSTRTDGYVLSTDIAPTILRLFGLSIPDEMDGEPIRTTGQIDPAAVDDLDARMSVIPDRRAPVVILSLVSWILVAALVGLLVPTRRRTVLAWLALAFAYMPLMLLAGAAFEPGGLPEGLLVGLGAAGLAAVTAFLARGWAALAIACAITVIAYGIDVATGSELTKLSLLGPNPILGVRFYGIGNELEALIAVMVPVGVGAALSARAIPGKAGNEGGAIAAFIGAGVLAAVVFAIGRFGADVGAAIVLPVGAAVAAGLVREGSVRISGRQTTINRHGRTVAAVISVPLLVLVLVALIDLVSGGNAHLTRSVLDAGGAGDLADIAQRRLELSADDFAHAAGNPLFWLVIAGICACIAKWRRIDAWLRPEPLARAGFLGACAAVAVGMFVNDSGATFLVLGSLALGATLAFAWAQARTDP